MVSRMGRQGFLSHGTTDSKGIMILINPKLDCKVEKRISDNNGRFILDVALEDSHKILVNIYASNDLNQQVKFFKLVQHHLEGFSGGRDSDYRRRFQLLLVVQR